MDFLNYESCFTASLLSDRSKDILTSILMDNFLEPIFSNKTESGEKEIIYYKMLLYIMERYPLLDKARVSSKYEQFIAC